MDLFPAPATLRIRGESDKMNFCAGICSLVLYIAFITVFIFMVIDIFEYNVIKANVINQVQNFLIQIIDKQVKVSNVPFAIGMIGVDIKTLIPLLTVRASI